MSCSAAGVGCGKTTITRLVNGLIPQFYAGELTGSVRVDGQEISGLTMYQIAAKVGSVFQNPRTQFFNVDTDSEIAFGIENEARPPLELAERVSRRRRTCTSRVSAAAISSSCPAEKSRRSPLPPSMP